MTLRVLAEADAEIIAAGRWYDDRQRELGDDFRAKVATALAEVARQPHRFPKVEFVGLRLDSCDFRASFRIFVAGPALKGS
jgi:hypothetical protein